MYGTKKGKSTHKGIKLMETQFDSSISNILNMDLHCAKYNEYLKAWIFIKNVSSCKGY